MSARPGVGFLGVGWIGRHRMEAMLATGAIEAVAIADPSTENAAEAAKLAPQAGIVGSLDDMLAQEVDAVVIATPSALHAEQSIRAFEAGAAVFCQKPLGRSAAEVQAVVDAARAADRLLGVDLSYRCTEGMRLIRALIQGGELGDIYAAELIFHNAYGPDKDWFYDRTRSGGGCVIDLGVHLVDLALWALDFPQVSDVAARLLAGGEPLRADDARVEDYAAATISLETGAAIQLACSWRLQAGREAIISAAFYGTAGGAALRNIGGSFYDFTAERYRGTSTETLSAPPDAWGGRAAAEWALRLAADKGYDPAADRLVDVARVLDLIYAH
ncbi:Gfo/Idh/MocA family protein [Sphingomonas sp.]|uniref:Gfo/Idh/MocA family protein n=1 Tax=Sphingomonas sp. TaxID=28214 RepID=UPI002FC96FD4